VVVGGDVVSPGAGEGVDDVQHVTANSRAWSSLLITSSSGERGGWSRRGLRCASDKDGGVDSLRV
jgi:hypothetical protein